MESSKHHLKFLFNTWRLIYVFCLQRSYIYKMHGKLLQYITPNREKKEKSKNLLEKTNYAN